MEDQYTRLVQQITSVDTISGWLKIYDDLHKGRRLNMFEIQNQNYPPLAWILGFRAANMCTKVDQGEHLFALLIIYLSELRADNNTKVNPRGCKENNNTEETGTDSMDSSSVSHLAHAQTKDAYKKIQSQINMCNGEINESNDMSIVSINLLDNYHTMVKACGIHNPVMSNLLKNKEPLQKRKSFRQRITMRRSSSYTPSKPPSLQIDERILTWAKIWARAFKELCDCEIDNDLPRVSYW